MNREEIAEAISEGVRAALLENPALHCRYHIAAEQHEMDHLALQRFMTFTSRLENVKWSVFQKLIVTGLIGLFTLMGYGFIMKLKLLNSLGLLWRP